MLIETRGGLDSIGSECADWKRDAGFRRSDVEHLSASASMVVGVKQERGGMMAANDAPSPGNVAAVLQ
jgi:hypothetical protein